MVNDNSLIVKGKKMKRLLIVGMMIALMLAGPALVVEPVKIGMITTLSTKAGYLGEEIRDGFQLAIDQEGGKLGQSDYAAEIVALRATKPDAVFFFLPGGMGINFLKQYAQAGLNQTIPVFGPAFSFDERLLQAVKDAAIGVKNGSQWSHDLDNPANLQFVAAFKEATGRTPTLYASQGYDAARLLGSALKQVGGESPIWTPCARPFAKPILRLSAKNLHFPPTSTRSRTCISARWSRMPAATTPTEPSKRSLPITPMCTSSCAN